MVSPNTRTGLRLAALALVAVALVALWYSGLAGEAMSRLDQESIRAWVDRAGPWGPALIIALMTAAIVASPIPSAPIAIASGAAYGHFYGTIYVIAGAESGALIAFLLARILGRGVLEKWFGDKLDIGLLGSQNALMMTVFASRLLPFVSFDLVSYAAGLSCLRFWRFALATLAGIIPASYLLAHFGGEVASADFGRATWAALALGLVTLTPLVIIAIRDYMRRHKERG